MSATGGAWADARAGASARNVTSSAARDTDVGLVMLRHVRAQARLVYEDGMDDRSWQAPGAEWSVLVHGGAGRRSDASLGVAVASCERAAEAAAALLEAGEGALTAVQRAVELLEDAPELNAGTGGALCTDGSLELDASIMDGSDLRAGAVCGLPPFRHPIAIARAVLEEGKHVLYAGQGAAAFARAKGFAPVAPELMITEQARKQLQRAIEAGQAQLWTGGTVGAVARDRHGHVAAATSTGGLPGQAPGRVGDSPIIGAGNAADDRRGACSVTGVGEAILRVSLASDVLQRLAAGDAPLEAARDAIEMLGARVQGTGGLIVAHHDGRLAHARNTPSMSWAARQAGGAAACGS